MKKIFTSFFVAAICLSTPLSLVAQVNVQDSLTLVDLYNSTDGPHWNGNANWLTKNPVSTWYGIEGVLNSSVTNINLDYNNLNGTLPSSIGNFTNLGTLLLV